RGSTATSMAATQRGRPQGCRSPLPCYQCRVTLAPGFRLAQYELTASLGAGGMGEVYRAKDLRLAREVAIKVMAPHIASDPLMRQRFEIEALAVASLSHPSIMPIHE